MPARESPGSLQQLYQYPDERNGEDREHGRHERHLRHQARVALILHAEHGAEGGHGHRHDGGVDVVDQLVDTTSLEEDVERLTRYI